MYDMLSSDSVSPEWEFRGIAAEQLELPLSETEPDHHEDRELWPLSSGGPETSECRHCGGDGTVAPGIACVCYPGGP